MFPRYVIPVRSLDIEHPLAMWEVREITNEGVSDKIIKVGLGNYDNTDEFPLSYGQVMELKKELLRNI